MPFKVKFLRIDDRLIHGQVIVGWLPVLKVSCVAVINEKVAKDRVRQEMMGLSVPPGIALKFFVPGASIDKASLPEDSLLLVASPQDAWKCLEVGIIPEKLNVGGMHAREGKKEVREAFHIDEEDREYFQKIIEHGIMPELQPTPQNEAIPLSEIL